MRFSTSRRNIGSFTKCFPNATIFRETKATSTRPTFLSCIACWMKSWPARGDQRPTERCKEAEPRRINFFGVSMAPAMEVEETDFGLRISTCRGVAQDKGYLRVSNFVMPNLCAVPGETQGAGYLVNWHVPIDDEHHWKYMIVFSREAPLDKEKFIQRYRTDIDSNYRPARNAANRYLQDRGEMKNKTFSGVGSFFPEHDLYATESMGPISDRTQEHLGQTDRAIIASRRLLLNMIRKVQQDGDPMHVIRDPGANRFPHLVVLSEMISQTTDWKNYWKTKVRE